VHIYLTRPFVLSWSFMEAMATGCLIVASQTPPVREMMEDGVNGLLVDFFDVEAMAKRIEAALTQPTRYAEIRSRARATIVDNYSRTELLPKHVELLQRLIRG